MKVIITILFLSFFSYSFSQNKITYKNVLTEIHKSHETLCVSLLIPNNDFYIGIYTKEWEVEDLTREQCGDIKTDSIKNSKIIGLLNSKNLLSKLFLKMENNEYENINSVDKFEWNKAKLIIELNFSNDWTKLNQVYIPIFNKKQAKQVIKNISKIFDSDYCFHKLKRKI